MARMMSTSKYTGTIAGHLLFWMVSFVVLLLVFNVSGPPGRIDVIYTFIFHLSLVPAVYVNLYLLIPVLFRKRRYLPFALVIAGVLTAFSLLNVLLFDRYADILFPDYYFVSYFVFRDVLIVHFIYLVVSTLLWLSQGWFLSVRQQQQIAELQSEKLLAELLALKNQINPHFFFNTLQNLYALSLKKSDLLPEMILKLSDLMRYVIHESSSKTVSLEKEIDFLENYIELQRLRLLGSATIDFRVKGKPEGKKISPLLLINFVENCFKHGLKGDIGAASATIRLTIEQGNIRFFAENPYDAANVSVKQNTGSGLRNVRTRLELDYPRRHRLAINDDGHVWRVELNINTDEDEMHHRG